MQTFAIISQKGGTGKTTLALNLAGAAEKAGKSTVIIDLDPQASSKQWSDSRDQETPVVISAHAARLDEVLEAARAGGAGQVIIDTAPHSERDALAAARAADLILIPTRAAILDLRAISSTIELATLAKTPALAILNAIPPRGSLPEEAAAAINSYGLKTAPVTIAQRIAFVHSLTIGQTVIEYEPNGKAAQEIKAVYMYASDQVAKSSSKGGKRAVA